MKSIIVASAILLATAFGVQADSGFRSHGDLVRVGDYSIVIERVCKVLSQTDIPLVYDNGYVEVVSRYRVKSSRGDVYLITTRNDVITQIQHIAHP